MSLRMFSRQGCLSLGVNLVAGDVPGGGPAAVLTMPHSMASISVAQSGKHCAFRVCRNTEKERCGTRGQMAREMPSLRSHGSRPEIQTRAASLFFSASFLSSPFRSHHLRPSASHVAVMSLVVDDQNVFHAHQVGHHALKPFGLQFPAC